MSLDVVWPTVFSRGMDGKVVERTIAWLHNFRGLRLVTARA
jgi:hypothetical protein